MVKTCKPFSLLANREKELLQLIANGDTSKIASGKLGLSQHTVNSYMTTIRMKLKAKTGSHAVAVGIRKGLIE